MENNQIDKKSSKKSNAHRTKKELAKKSLSDAKEIVSNLKQIIATKCSEMGIKEPVLEHRTQCISADPVGNAHRRNDKVLQAIYTLLEANIEAIVLNGMIMAMSDSSATGAAMVRYWCDKYLPSVEANKDWTKDDKPSSLTYIQQAIQVKMQLDSQGMSMDDVHKLLVKQIPQDSLVETTSTCSDEIINDK